MARNLFSKAPRLRGARNKVSPYLLRFLSSHPRETLETQSCILSLHSIRVYSQPRFISHWPEVNVFEEDRRLGSDCGKLENVGENANGKKSLSSFGDESSMPLLRKGKLLPKDPGTAGEKNPFHQLLGETVDSQYANSDRASAEEERADECEKQVMKKEQDEMNGISPKPIEMMMGEIENPLKFTSFKEFEERFQALEEKINRATREVEELEERVLILSKRAGEAREELQKWEENLQGEMEKPKTSASSFEALENAVRNLANRTAKAREGLKNPKRSLSGKSIKSETSSETPLSSFLFKEKLVEK